MQTLAIIVRVCPIAYYSETCLIRPALDHLSSKTTSSCPNSNYSSYFDLPKETTSLLKPPIISRFHCTTVSSLALTIINHPWFMHHIKFESFVSKKAEHWSNIGITIHIHFLAWPLLCYRLANARIQGRERLGMTHSHQFLVERNKDWKNSWAHSSFSLIRVWIS